MDIDFSIVTPEARTHRPLFSILCGENDFQPRILHVIKLSSMGRKIRTFSNEQGLKKLPANERCKMAKLTSIFGRSQKSSSSNELLRHITKSKILFLKFAWYVFTKRFRGHFFKSSIIMQEQ